jgi:D-alanyl-lipoteichoic acid acyltransferase DltB (MBOAT superfamily)
LVVASYVFYGWWDYRFLSLIFFSSLVDYVVGLRLHSTSGRRARKALLGLSLGTNLGMLGFFKYYDFFVESFVRLVQAVGMTADLRTLNIILPVGISFYTFQTLSYTIDVYRGKIPPTRDAVAFFAFVSFFPQLVAGPIERARHLLPQFFNPRHFDIALAKDGIRQMLWGFFKKLVVADNVAGIVEAIFANSAQADSLTLHFGVLLFAFQIYCDFSGYSDIAIGVGRLFGFDLMRNFAFPYFSRDIAEFWRRWHISLSTWFRDYVYIPLGGSQVKRARRILNVFVTFGLSGLWHGAAWTFVIWGLLNAAYYIPIMVSGKHRQHDGPISEGRLLPTVGDAWRIAATFYFTLLAWVFFRADSAAQAVHYLFRMLTLRTGDGYSIDVSQVWPFLALIGGLVLAEWHQRDKQHALQVGALPGPARWAIYVVVFVAILVAGNFGEIEFIYFQF